MMRYKILDFGDGLHRVLEDETVQVVSVHKKREVARDVMRNLNMGGGFDGFTPNFFLVDVKNILTSN